MSDTNPTRPPQVTMAGWIAILGSVFVVVGHFEAVANLRSIETRERVARMVSEPPLEGWGATVEGWLSLLHAVSMVGAASAAAAAILGVWVLRRNHAARIGLTVAAVPLLATGFLTSGFLSTLVAVSVVMLWGRQGRDWFAGKSWVPPTLPERRREQPPASPAPPAPPAPASGREPSPSATGSPDVPPPLPWERAAEPVGGFVVRPQAPQPPRRPAALVWACALTWSLAGLVAAGCLLSAATVGLAPDVFQEGWAQEDLDAQTGMSWEEGRRTMLGAALMFGVWALGAVVLALFTFLGREWARFLLVASASAAGALFLLSLAAGPTGLLLVLPGVACVATVILLLRPDVSAWMRARRTP